MTAKPERLSSNQLRLWITSQLASSSAIANLSSHHILRGDLDKEALEVAFSAMVERHTVLRTSYQLIEGEPAQFLNEVRTTVLFHEAGHQGRAQIDMWFAEQARLTFELARAPLVRLAVASETPVLHHALLTIHHIACDEHSMRILHSELWGDYDSFSRSSRVDQREDAPQYVEWARQQDAVLASSRGERMARFWAEQMRDAAYTELLPDQFVPLDDRSAASAVEQHISRDVTTRLERIAREERASLFTVFQAALTVLLNHATDRRDIVTGTAVDGRSGPQFESAVGFFTNLLPIRIHLDEGSSVRDAIRHARDAVLDALDNREFPFDSIVRLAGPPRIAGKNPLFQVALELLYEDSSVDPSRASGAELNGLIGNRTTWFDVSVVVVRTALDCHITLTYAHQLFSHLRMQQLLGAFVRVLEAFAEEPSAPVSSLDPFAEPGGRPGSTKLRPALDAWHLRVKELAWTEPNRTSIVVDGKRHSYSDVYSKGRELALRIRAAHLGDGANIAVPIGDPAEFVATVLGVHMAGCSVVPLIGESLTESPIHSVGYVSAIVTDEGLARIDAASRLSVHGELTHEGPDESRRVAAPDHDDAAFILLGRSGESPVVISHAVVARSLQVVSRELELLPGTRIAWTPSPSSGFAFVELCAALASGAEVAVAPAAEGAFVPFLREAAIEVLSSPTIRLAKRDPGPLPDLRTLAVSDGPVPSAVRRRWAEPHRRIIGIYTHNHAYPIVGVFNRDDLRSTLAPRICRLAYDDGTVENSYGHRAAIGSPGELVLGDERGPRSFLVRPRIFDGVAAAPIRGRTADVFSFLSEGTFYYRGRLEDQLLIRGQATAIIDIENGIEQLDMVRLAVVVRGRLGSGRDVLVAHVLVDGKDVDEARFRSELRKHLPRHVPLPDIRFLDEFPLTSGGEIDRTTLASVGDQPTSSSRQS